MDVLKYMKERDELLRALQASWQRRGRAALRAWGEDLVARCLQPISTEHPCSVEITHETEGGNPQ